MKDKVIKEEQLREKLWIKANKEYISFKQEILSKSKEEIYQEAYIISLFKDFRMMCDPEYSQLSLDEVKVLLKEKYPVRKLCNYYMKTEAGGLSDLYSAINYGLKELVKINQEKNITQDRER